MTAWAPNTYQRPQSASTLDSAVRSSTAAGGSTREQLGQAHVRKQVLPPGDGPGPIRIVQQCLPAQLVGDAEALQWSAAGYAFGPIGVFRGARRAPFASHVVTNAAADHTGSVAGCPGRVHVHPRAFQSTDDPWSCGASRMRACRYSRAVLRAWTPCGSPASSSGSAAFMPSPPATPPPTSRRASHWRPAASGLMRAGPGGYSVGL